MIIIKGYFLFCLLFSLANAVGAQDKATGLSEVRLYIDPGHYGFANMGLFGYSEAEKVLRVAHALKDYLLAYTDMQEENIMLSRESDYDPDVSLASRASQAIAFGAHFYYSIHSDAAASQTANSVLFLYGGRRAATGSVPVEKLPEGGKEFGEILQGDLSSVMRVNSRGVRNDLEFYGSPNLVPYLAVHRLTDNIIASHLSEAGFHTNPTQQMQNMNAEWRKLQAYAAYQSLVKFLSKHYGDAPVMPVQAGIATGFITDSELGNHINGAKITITEGETEKVYVTDTYESTFHKYSNDPNELRNGFYWIEGFSAGATVKVKVEADGYETYETTLTIPESSGEKTQDGLGVLDVALNKLIPPIVIGLEPEVFAQNMLTAHPNPTQGMITLQFEKNGVYMLSIIDASGKLLKRQTYSEQTVQLDVSDFPTGVYMMIIDDGIQQNIIKIIKI